MPSRYSPCAMAYAESLTTTTTPSRQSFQVTRLRPPLTGSPSLLGLFGINLIFIFSPISSTNSATIQMKIEEEKCKA